MRNWKRVASTLLCATMLGGLLITGASAAEVPSGLTRTDLFEAEEMLDFGTQGTTSRHTHGLTLTEMPSGDLFAVWFSSNPSGERDANECRLIGAWLPKEEIGKENAQWSDPFEVYNLDGVPSNNPATYVDQNGRLWVFFNTILNGQWVSAIPRYIYADPASYESAIENGTNPDWHYPVQMSMTVGDTYGGQGTWNEETQQYTYRTKGDKLRYITEEQYAQHPLPDDQCVKVTSRFDENNTVYVTDRFVVAINNQMNAAVEYLETEKPYDDAFGQRNDIVLQSVNEGIFSTDPYKSEPSLRDGAIWRASGADNDLKTWNPAFRRMGWQTKNAPIEFTLPAGTPLSNGGTSDGSTTRMLLPLYSDSLALSICAYTDDYGETWAYSDPIAGLGNIQGNLVMKEDGTLYQYFRSGKLDGKNGRLDWKLTRSESHDYGVTWENIYVEPYLRNDGGVGLDVTSDGKWVLTHNQDAKEDLRSGCRNSVTLSVSSDEGQSWKSIMLDTAAQENGSYTGMDYQYPGVICTSSGWIVVAYTNGGRGGPSQVMRSTMLQESELDRLLSMDLNVAETAKLQAGETMQLQPKLTLDGQEVQLAEDDLIYRTSGTAIATVDGNGLVTAVADGQAKIIVTSKTYGTIGECLLTVGEDSSSGGGSSGGGTTQSYRVTVAKAENGSVTASSSKAAQGSTVTVTMKPDAGYVADQLTVVDSKGNAISTSSLGNGKYSFKMPGADVTVTGTFVALTDGKLPFSDVGANDWYYNAVVYAWENGIMNGVSDNTFAPAQNLSRGMLAQILYALEEKPAAQSAGFTDTAGKWYAAAADWAAKNQIMSGYGNGLFGGEDLVTREQLAVTLRAYAQYKGMSTATAGDLSKFADQDQASAWAVDGLKWAVGEGLLSGKDGNRLDPAGTAQRCEVAQVMMAFLKNA